MQNAVKRRARRRAITVVYSLLWLLTLAGTRSVEPQLLTIPLWYWWVGLVLLLLVPINAYFVRACWPEVHDG